MVVLGDALKLPFRYAQIWHAFKLENCSQYGKIAMLFYSLTTFLIFMSQCTLKHVYVIMSLYKFKYKLTKSCWKWLTCRSYLLTGEMPLVWLPECLRMLFMAIIFLAVVEEVGAVPLTTHRPPSHILIAALLVVALVAVTARPCLLGG